MLWPQKREHHRLRAYSIDIIVFPLIACHCKGVVVMDGVLLLFQRGTSWPEGPVKPRGSFLQPCVKLDLWALPQWTHCRVKSTRRAGEVKRRGKEISESFSEIPKSRRLSSWGCLCRVHLEEGILVLFHIYKVIEAEPPQRRVLNDSGSLFHEKLRLQGMARRQWEGICGEKSTLELHWGIQAYICSEVPTQKPYFTEHKTNTS